MMGLSQLIWKRVQSFITIQGELYENNKRMHLIFTRQYIKQIMEYKVDFVVGVLGVFLTQVWTSCFSMYSLLYSSFRRLDLSGGALSMAFLNSQGTGPSLFLTISGHWGNAWCERESLTTLTIHQPSLSHPSQRPFQIDTLGRLLVGGILLATTVTSISWTFLNSCFFLVYYSFATLIYTS